MPTRAALWVPRAKGERVWGSPGRLRGRATLSQVSPPSPVVPKWRIGCSSSRRFRVATTGGGGGGGGFAYEGEAAGGPAGCLAGTGCGEGGRDGEGPALRAGEGAGGKQVKGAGAA